MHQLADRSSAQLVPACGACKWFRWRQLAAQHGGRQRATPAASRDQTPHAALFMQSFAADSLVARQTLSAPAAQALDTSPRLVAASASSTPIR